MKFPIAASESVPGGGATIRVQFACVPPVLATIRALVLDTGTLVVGVARHAVHYDRVTRPLSS